MERSSASQISTELKPSAPVTTVGVTCTTSSFTVGGTISGLVEGQTYYFVATSYTVLGLESIPSNEIAYLVPAPGVPLRRRVRFRT